MALLDFDKMGDDFSNFLKSPQAQGMAAALLKAGAVSPRPINMSEAMGNALSAGQAANTQGLQNQYMQSLIANQQFQAQQRERELQVSKELGDLMGAPAKNPAQAGMFLQRDAYKGTGLLGGEMTMPEYKMRAMGALGKAGKYKEALGLLSNGEYGTPVQALDASGKPVFVVPNKQGGYKTLEGISPIPKKGTSLNVGPDGTITFEQGGSALPGNQAAGSKTINQLQGDIESSMQSLGKLDQIAKDYNKNYLTYSGQSRGAIGSFVNKLTGEPFDKEFVQGRTKFKMGVEQLFNQYRKEITGAAAAVQELDRLYASMLNANLSPQEFEAAYGQFRTTVEQALRIKQKLLREGIPLGSKEFGERLDAELLGGGQPSNQAPNQRGGQPIAQSGAVMIRTPDGRTMALPGDKLDQALKLGAQRIS